MGSCCWRLDNLRGRGEGIFNANGLLVGAIKKSTIDRRIDSGLFTLVNQGVLDFGAVAAAVGVAAGWWAALAVRWAASDSSEVHGPLGKWSILSDAGRNRQSAATYY